MHTTTRTLLHASLAFRFSEIAHLSGTTLPGRTAPYRLDETCISITQGIVSSRVCFILSVASDPRALLPPGVGWCPCAGFLLAKAGTPPDMRLAGEYSFCQSSNPIQTRRKSQPPVLATVAAGSGIARRMCHPERICVYGVPGYSRSPCSTFQRAVSGRGHRSFVALWRKRTTRTRYVRRGLDVSVRGRMYACGVDLFVCPVRLRLFTDDHAPHLRNTLLVY